MVESAAVTSPAEGHAAARVNQDGRPTRMRVADLRPSDRNPRTISTARLENLKRSLREDRAFLDARPLLVNSHPGRENMVIAGNMRLRAAQELGWEEVPVLVVSVPPDVEAQWNLKDNNQWGDYVDEDLAEILQGLDASGVDIGLLGFTNDEVERFLALVGIGAQADDNGFDPTPPAEPASRAGDLYVMGPHHLICGDARDTATWSRLFTALGVETADAMWTDPPYGIDLQVDGATAMGGDRPEEIGPLLRATLPLADQRLTPGAPWYVCAPTGRTFAEFEQEIERVGWHHAQTLVWVKNAFVPGRGDYHHQHEAVLASRPRASPPRRPCRRMLARRKSSQHHPARTSREGPPDRRNVEDSQTPRWRPTTPGSATSSRRHFVSVLAAGIVVIREGLPADPYQIADHAQHREQSGEDNRARSEGDRVTARDRLEREKTQPVPNEEVFDDRQTGNRDSQSAAEGFDDDGPCMRQDVHAGDPRWHEALGVGGHDEIGIQDFADSHPNELRRDRYGRDCRSEQRKHDVLVVAKAKDRQEAPARACGQQDYEQLEEIRYEERRDRREEARGRDERPARDRPTAQKADADTDQRPQNQTENRSAGEKREAPQGRVGDQLGQRLLIDLGERAGAVQLSCVETASDRLELTSEGGAAAEGERGVPGHRSRRCDSDQCPHDEHHRGNSDKAQGDRIHRRISGAPSSYRAKAYVRNAAASDRRSVSSLELRAPRTQIVRAAAYALTPGQVQLESLASVKVG